MADPGPISPAIDDSYWFAYSKEIVEKALGSRNDQAAKLQSLIAWLWTIYTASAAVVLNLGKANYSFGITLLIALPSGILIFAYWSAVQAQAPVDTEFDPRSPTAIREAYDQALIQKEKQLKWAKGWSIAGGVAVAVALMAASLGRQSPNPEFGAARKGALVTVWGRGMACEVVTISISAESESAGPITVPCSTRGDFAAQLPLNPQAKGPVAKIEWIDPKKVTHTMARAVE